MDPATIRRLAEEHPEQYLGGQMDRDSPIGRVVTTADAWDRARRNLDNDYPPGAAYWAGFANMQPCCQRCGHYADWHHHDDTSPPYVNGHNSHGAILGEDAECPYRCIGHDCECPDFAE